MDAILDYVFSNIFQLSGAAVIGFLLACVIWFAMSQPIVTVAASGTVRGVEYHAPYTTFQPMMSGKTTTLMPIHHPARWTAQVAVQGVLVEHDLPFDVKEGEQLVVRYRVEEICKPQ